MSSNLLGALRLGGVGHPVPHGRVDDLQPLSRQRLERLAVRHAPLSAPGVVVAPSPLCPGEVVAREYEQVFQPLVALARCCHRGDRGPRLAVARRQAAARSEPVVAGEVFDIDGDRKLGSGFGTYPRHSQEAPAGIVALEETRISAMIASISAEFSDILRVSSFTARPSAAMAAASGLAEEAVERTRPPIFSWIVSVVLRHPLCSDPGDETRAGLFGLPSLRFHSSVVLVQMSSYRILIRGVRTRCEFC